MANDVKITDYNQVSKEIHLYNGDLIVIKYEGEPYIPIVFMVTSYGKENEDYSRKLCSLVRLHDGSRKVNSCPRTLTPEELASHFRGKISEIKVLPSNSFNLKVEVV